MDLELFAGGIETVIILHELGQGGLIENLQHRVVGLFEDFAYRAFLLAGAIVAGLICGLVDTGHQCHRAVQQSEDLTQSNVVRRAL